MDPWTSFLDFLSTIITPTWNDLLQYMPLLLLGLIALSVALLARAYARNAAINRSRVPQRVAFGPAPAGVHLPGPSLWPFIVPFAGGFVLLSLVFHPSGLPVNPVLLPIGLVLALVAVLGWFRDAGREWHRTEQGAHAVLAPSTQVVPVVPKEPPPGVHLPGPSPWPFFAPVALLFIFAGLIFGPLLILGGLVMAIIAALGWYLDAGYEFRQVDAGAIPVPRTRDPRQAFPISVVKVYFGIAAVVILITISPWLFSFLPSGSAAPSGPAAQTPSANPVIGASSALSFDTKSLLVVADKALTITFNNKQAGIDHNVAIYDAPKGNEIFKGDLVKGPATATYNVPALKAGTYYFQCDVHPNMNGQLVSK